MTSKFTFTFGTQLYCSILRCFVLVFSLLVKFQKISLAVGSEAHLDDSCSHELSTLYSQGFLAHVYVHPFIN